MIDGGDGEEVTPARKRVQPETPPGTAFDAGTGDLIGVKWQGWQLVIGSAHDLITELSKKLPDVPDEDKPVLREQATQLRNELDVLLALAA